MAKPHRTPANEAAKVTMHYSGQMDCRDLNGAEEGAHNPPLLLPFAPLSSDHTMQCAYFKSARHAMRCGRMHKRSVSDPAFWPESFRPIALVMVQRILAKMSSELRSKCNVDCPTARCEKRDAKLSLLSRWCHSLPRDASRRMGDLDTKIETISIKLQWWRILYCCLSVQQPLRLPD